MKDYQVEANEVFTAAGFAQGGAVRIEKLREAIAAALRAAHEAGREDGLDEAASTCQAVATDAQLEPDLAEYGEKKSASAIINHAHAVGWINATKVVAVSIRALKGGSNE